MNVVTGPLSEGNMKDYIKVTLQEGAPGEYSEVAFFHRRDIRTIKFVPDQWVSAPTPYKRAAHWEIQIKDEKPPIWLPEVEAQRILNFMEEEI